MVRTPRATRWCIKLDHPTNEEKTHLATIFSDPTIVTYGIIKRVAGEQGTTPHLKCFVIFRNQQTYNAVWTMLGACCEIEPTIATSERNREYCSKEGDFDEYRNDVNQFLPDTYLRCPRATARVCQWSKRFAELLQFRQVHGHCNVPNKFPENLPLARWVKRQRYQYNLLVELGQSHMSLERLTALEQIGFVWDMQEAVWCQRLGELRAFYETFGHCNVPSNYEANPHLGTWVKCQRRQYRLFLKGKPSNITQHRVDDLDALGFEWLMRDSYNKRKV